MLLIGDIHGDKSFPYTNAKTAKRWKALQGSTLKTIFELPYSDRIQLGDLFDSFMVNAEEFISGAYVASRCHKVLAGNHDTSNNTERASALNLLTGSCVDESTVVWGEVECCAIAGINYVLVPHQLTQQKFEEALETAKSYCVSTIPNILLLHCNYGDREGSFTENYLRTAKAKELLEHFVTIASGHEHNTNTPRSGVQMCGSILPMNFGEMSDKCVWRVQPDGVVTPLLVWRAEDNYALLTFQQFLELPVDSKLQFIEVTGTVNLSESVAVNKRIADWYLHSETLIAIKNATTHLKREDAETGKPETDLDWVKLVAEQMTKEEQELFQDLLNFNMEK